MFDLDGTLINSLDDLAASTNYALMERGFPLHSVDEYKYMVGNGATRLCERALPAYARTPEQIHALRQLFQRHYMEHGMDQTRPYPGITWMLHALKLRGMTMAVVTNKPDEAAQLFVERMFGSSIFSVVIGQRDGMPVKPDPTLTLEAVRRMELKPAECAYLGDSGVDMQTASAAGARGIGALWGFRTSDELLENGAMAIISTPEELPPLLARWSAE